MSNDLERLVKPPALTNTNTPFDLRQELRGISLALGRIVALLDPMFAIPEDHPLRRADSDRLAETVIKKLLAEDAARRATGGEP